MIEFSIMIVSQHAHLSHNWREIKQVSNYNFFVIGHLRHSHVKWARFDGFQRNVFKTEGKRY